MKALYVSWEQKFQPIAKNSSWIPLILARIIVGWTFLQAGWGKFANLERVIGFFDSIGIPLASIQAPMVAGFEFFGGLFLILGLLTRVMTLPLIFVMFIALITAHASEIGSVSDLFGQTPFLYISLMIVLLFFGPGKISADHLIIKR